MKYKVFLLFVLFIGVSSVVSQSKQEREFRIKESEFPSSARKLITPYLGNAKRVRFYKEVDGDKVSFETKFKKGKLKYSVEFSKNGELEDVEFIIKKVDIPNRTFEMISNYLALNHQKYRIKKIQQQYLNQEENPISVLKAAFQNLILPEINYELIVASKDDKGYSEYEITFNSDGEHLLSRKLVKPKYDHILY
ncbi:hypothetical protein [Croceitalea sp. MTPC6]